MQHATHKSAGAIYGVNNPRQSVTCLQAELFTVYPMLRIGFANTLSDKLFGLAIRTGYWVKTVLGFIFQLHAIRICPKIRQYACACESRYGFGKLQVFRTRSCRYCDCRGVIEHRQTLERLCASSY